MISIDLKNKKSIYEQIIDGFKEEIVSGRLSSGDQLPSVRDLSSRLTVNPNTIQKAFRALEEQGFIYSVVGRGSFVADNLRGVSDKQKEEIYSKIEAAVDELRYLGVNTNEIMKRITKMANERGVGDDKSK